MMSHDVCVKGFHCIYRAKRFGYHIVSGTYTSRNTHTPYMHQDYREIASVKFMVGNANAAFQFITITTPPPHQKKKK